MSTDSDNVLLRIDRSPNLLSPEEGRIRIDRPPKTSGHASKKVVQDLFSSTRCAGFLAFENDDPASIDGRQLDAAWAWLRDDRDSFLHAVVIPGDALPLGKDVAMTAYPAGTRSYCASSRVAFERYSSAATRDELVGALAEDHGETCVQSRVQLILQMQDDPTIELSAQVLFDQRRRDCDTYWLRWNGDDFVPVLGNPWFLQGRSGTPPVIDEVLMAGFADDRTGKALGPSDIVSRLRAPALGLAGKRVTSLVLFGDESAQAVKDVAASLKAAQLPMNVFARNDVISTTAAGDSFVAKQRDNAVVMTADGNGGAILGSWLSGKTAASQSAGIAKQLFEARPEQFATEWTVDTRLCNVLSPTPSAASACVLERLSDASRTMVVAPCPAGTKHSMRAHVLPAFRASEQRDAPFWIDLPASPGESEPHVLITQQLSRGSLIVTNSPGGSDELRVYRDCRINASLLYSNVVAAVDYEDYRSLAPKPGDPFEPSPARVAAAYMVFDGSTKKWQLVVQHLEDVSGGRAFLPEALLRSRDFGSVHSVTVSPASKPLDRGPKSQAVAERAGAAAKRMDEFANQYGVSTLTGGGSCAKIIAAIERRALEAKAKHDSDRYSAHGSDLRIADLLEEYVATRDAIAARAAGAPVVVTEPPALLWARARQRCANGSALEHARGAGLDAITAGNRAQRSLELLVKAEGPKLGAGRWMPVLSAIRSNDHD